VSWWVDEGIINGEYMSVDEPYGPALAIEALG
jgi:hypothetical protein